MRRSMGAVTTGADVTIITSDSARDEDPSAICQQILQGVPREQRRSTRIVLDRERAITDAVGEARPGDVVLVCGRGRERFLTIGDSRIAISDSDVARRALQIRHSTR